MLEKFDINSLPSPPHLLLKLLATCDQEEVVIEDMAALIRQDGAITAKVLALVHTRPHVAGQRRGLLLPALQALGGEEVRTIALNAALAAATATPEDLPGLKRLWRHGLLNAHLAQALAAKAGYADSEEAYFAGLLHDLGRSILWCRFPQDYPKVAKGVNDEATLLARESRMLGINHAEAGAQVVRAWGMKSFLADALRYHHEPAPRLTSAHPLVRIAAVAQHLAGLEDDATPDASVLALLNLTLTDAQAVLQVARTHLLEAERQFGIETEPLPAPEPPPGAEAEGERRRYRVDQGRRAPSAQELADQRIQQGLAQLVRDMVALDTMKNGLFAAGDAQAWRQALALGLQAGFGLTGAMLFLPQGRDGILRGVPDASGTLAEQIAIPADDPYSLLARALREMRPLHSLQEDAMPLSVLDEQVIGLTGKPGMICLPLLNGGVPAGLVVCGIDADDAQRLDERLPLLARIGAQAARALRLRKAARVAEAAGSSPPEQARRLLHEINNPLNIIKNYLRILDMKLPPEDLAHGDLKIISDEIERVAGLVKGLAGAPAFAPRMGPGVDINRLILEVVNLVKPTLLTPAKIMVETLLAPNLPELFTDAGQVKQILQNLTKNAAEAMPEGGKLQIVTRRLQSGADTWIEIRIEDSGHGIPAAIRAKLFQPVASSKGGEHAGLGLSIVHGLVRGLGGSIECEARPDGAAFIIHLPASKRPPSERH